MAKQQFAVFDIDGVLTKVSLLEQLIHVLVVYGKLDVGPAERIELLLRNVRDLVAEDNFNKHISQATSILFTNVQNGLSTQEYAKFIDIAVKKSIAQNFTYTIGLMQALKRQNFFLIALSHSERQLVATYARALGFDAWLGQISYAESNGRFTGEVNTLAHPKDAILTTIINKFNLNTEGSLAVGDVGSDAALLQMCASPIAFNPTQELFKIAQENSWMVVIESKDMIYGLENKNGLYTLTQMNT